jgi:hypothetical protein
LPYGQGAEKVQLKMIGANVHTSSVLARKAGIAVPVAHEICSEAIRDQQ